MAYPQNTLDFKYLDLEMLLIEMPWPTHRSQMCLKTKADWHIIEFERVLVEAKKSRNPYSLMFLLHKKNHPETNSAPFQGKSDQLLSRSNGAQIFSSSELLGPHPSSPWGAETSETPKSSLKTEPTLCPGNWTCCETFFGTGTQLVQNLQKAFGKVKPTKKVIASILFHQPWCPAMAAIFKHHFPSKHLLLWQRAQKLHISAKGCTAFAVLAKIKKLQP